jgi:hypothetical protein
MRSRAPRARVILLAVLVPALVASLTACGDVAIAPDPTPVPGAGEVVTETRDVGTIERISVAAPITVVLRTGEPGSVTVSAQANIQPLVNTEVKDGQLIVNVSSPGYETTEPVTLTVVAPAITSVTVSGGATGVIEAVADALRVDLSGESELDGLGRVGTLTLTMSSDARAAFAELIVGSAVVALSGGAAAELTVVDSLTGDASEGATVTLASQPAVVDVAVSSGGSVQGDASPAP